MLQFYGKILEDVSKNAQAMALENGYESFTVDCDASMYLAIYYFLYNLIEVSMS